MVLTYAESDKSISSSNIIEDNYRKNELNVHEKSVKIQYLPHNVIYPKGNEQKYIPMLDYKTEEGNYVNEIDIIKKAINRDKEDKDRHITTFYFMSPPGLGKTVLGGFLARFYNCPYQILNCVSTLTDLDLLGNHILIGQETVWQDGPIPSIIRATNNFGMGILIINEFNALTLNAQIALNPLLDRQESVVIAQNNNELVKLEENCHLLIIATMNPDILGVNELQDSIRDRSNAVIHMDYPSTEKEVIIIKELIQNIPIETIRQFVEIVNECRLLKIRDFQISKAPSTRGLLDWIKYSYVWGVETAFELTIVNKYGTNEEERKAIKLIGKGKGLSYIELHNNEVKIPESSIHIRAQQKAYDLYSIGVKVQDISASLRKSKSTIYKYIANQKKIMKLTDKIK